MPGVEIRVPVVMVSPPNVAVPVPKCNVPAPTFTRSCPPDIPADPNVIVLVGLMLLVLDKVIAPL